jgi:uncharacterized membrane protein
MSRPRIKIGLQAVDRLTEMTGWAALILMIILPLVYMKELPDQVPRHFNLSGEPDAFAGKEIIWLSPLLGMILWAGLTLVNRFPHFFSYPVRITEENAGRLYRLATRTLRILKTLLITLFLYLTISIIWIGLGRATTLNGAGILCFILLIFLLVGVMIYKMIRNR